MQGSSSETNSWHGLSESIESDSEKFDELRSTTEPKISSRDVKRWACSDANNVKTLLPLVGVGLPIGKTMVCGAPVVPPNSSWWTYGIAIPAVILEPGLSMPEHYLINHNLERNRNESERAYGYLRAQATESQCLIPVASGKCRVAPLKPAPDCN
ncbi:hypothetical protein NPIL_115831 [Nephila pilipes]|uniref:Uncharacterized protein n=1 Tax=Nephila pilipes TaxID=299642 RepID=A0A8X6PD65_NEPPI|nr:hypothetical protein NPIL_115831 [Nephila pilipes]